MPFGKCRYTVKRPRILNKEEWAKKEELDVKKLEPKDEEHFVQYEEIGSHHGYILYYMLCFLIIVFFITGGASPIFVFNGQKSVGLALIVCSLFC